MKKMGLGAAHLMLHCVRKMAVVLSGGQMHFAMASVIVHRERMKTWKIVLQGISL